MNKIFNRVILIFGLILLGSATCYCQSETPDNVAKDFNWEPVMKAIISVESKGNPNAQRGSSVGVLQITPILVAECNNILKRRKSKKRYSLKDRFNENKSKEMFILIQSFHNPLNDIEHAIRSWNGGIRYSFKKTQKYFEKVMGILNNKVHKSN